MKRRLSVVISSVFVAVLALQFALPEGAAAFAKPGPEALSAKVKTALASPSPPSRTKGPRSGPGGIDQGDSTRRVVGTTLGVTLLLLSILYWSDGFGALGLRSALAAQHERRKRRRAA